MPKGESRFERISNTLPMLLLPTNMSELPKSVFFPNIIFANSMQDNRSAAYWVDEYAGSRLPTGRLLPHFPLGERKSSENTAPEFETSSQTGSRAYLRDPPQLNLLIPKSLKQRRARVQNAVKYSLVTPLQPEKSGFPHCFPQNSVENFSTANAERFW